MRGNSKLFAVLPEASRTPYPRSRPTKPSNVRKKMDILKEPALYKPWDSIPQVAMDGAKKALYMLYAQYHKAGTKSITSYIDADFDGKYKASPTFFTCYGGLRHDYPAVPDTFNAADKKYIAYFCTVFIRDLGDKYSHFPEEENRYLEWLFNKSMFAECFVTKTAKDARKHGVICNTHLPASILVQACTFGRNVSHMARVPKMWNILVDAGVDAHLALLAAHQFSPITPSDYTEVVPVMMDGGNSVFNTLRWFTDDGFKRFVNQDRSKWHGDPFYKAPGKYGWFLTQWNEDMIAKACENVSDTPGEEYSMHTVHVSDKCFQIMQDYGYTPGTAIPLQDAIDQCKHLQQKYIG